METTEGEERSTVEQPVISEERVPIKVIPVQEKTEAKRRKRYSELEKRRMTYKKKKVAQPEVAKDVGGTEDMTDGSNMIGIALAGLTAIFGFVMLKNKL